MAAGKTFLVVDASLWVARLVPQDAFHVRVRSWMDACLLEGTEFVAPALLLAETAGAISRNTRDAHLAARAVALLEHLPGLRLVEMDGAMLKEAARLAAELGLRAADAVYVAVASRLNIPLVTLDTDQHLRAGEWLSCVEIP